MVEEKKSGFKSGGFKSGGFKKKGGFKPGGSFKKRDGFKPRARFGPAQPRDGEGSPDTPFKKFYKPRPAGSFRRDSAGGDSPRPFRERSGGGEGEYRPERPRFRSGPGGGGFKKRFSRDGEEGARPFRPRRFSEGEGGGSDRPRRFPEGDRPRRAFGSDRPRRDFGSDRPRRDFDSDRPRREFDGERPRRPFGSDRPQRDFDRPRRFTPSEGPRGESDSPRRREKREENPHVWRSRDEPLPEAFRKKRPFNRDRFLGAESAEPAPSADGEGLVIHGKHTVISALQAGRRILKVFISPEVKFFEEVRELAEKGLVPIIEKERKELDRITQSDSHQGVGALIEPVPLLPADQLMEKVQNGKIQKLLFLDNIQDGGNLGSIIRSAVAFGFTDIVLGEHRTTPVTARAFKASAGTIEKVTLYQVNNLANLTNDLKERKFWFYGASAHAEKGLHDMAFNFPMVLVMGGEEKGIHRTLEKQLDGEFKIPMANGVESLNVTQSFSITAYIISQQSPREAAPAVVAETLPEPLPA